MEGPRRAGSHTWAFPESQGGLVQTDRGPPWSLRAASRRGGRGFALCTCALEVLLLDGGPHLRTTALKQGEAGMQRHVGLHWRPWAAGQVGSPQGPGRVYAPLPCARSSGRLCPAVMNSTHLRSAESTSVQIYWVFINCFTVTVSKSITWCCPPEAHCGLRLKLRSQCCTGWAQTCRGMAGAAASFLGLHEQWALSSVSEPEPQTGLNSTPQTRTNCTHSLILGPNPNLNVSCGPLSKPVFKTQQAGRGRDP